MPGAQRYSYEGENIEDQGRTARQPEGSRSSDFRRKTGPWGPLSPRSRSLGTGRNHEGQALHSPRLGFPSGTRSAKVHVLAFTPQLCPVPQRAP